MSPIALETPSNRLASSVLACATRVPVVLDFGQPYSGLARQWPEIFLPGLRHQPHVRQGFPAVCRRSVAEPAVAPIFSRICCESADTASASPPNAAPSASKRELSMRVMMPQHIECVDQAHDGGDRVMDGQGVVLNGLHGSWNLVVPWLPSESPSTSPRTVSDRSSCDSSSAILVVWRAISRLRDCRRRAVLPLAQRTSQRAPLNAPRSCRTSSKAVPSPMAVALPCQLTAHRFRPARISRPPRGNRKVDSSSTGELPLVRWRRGA